jgi:energy-coupling factor transporter transmembrane protein EcfT
MPSFHGSHSFAIPVKIWVVFGTMMGVFFAPSVSMTWKLVLAGFLFIGLQRKWQVLFSYMLFYGVLTLLLFLIRQYGLRMALFSEFHILVFWILTSIFMVSWDLITSPPGAVSYFLSQVRAPGSLIITVLVMFRFFPTLRTELRRLWESMHNRGLTSACHILLHPLLTFEYIVVPILIRFLQIADQLSVSALSRGINAPGIRSSYHSTAMRPRDYCGIIGYTLFIVLFLTARGSV